MQAQVEAGGDKTLVSTNEGIALTQKIEQAVNQSGTTQDRNERSTANKGISAPTKGVVRNGG